MKKISKASIVAILVCFVLTLSSCGGLFTASLMPSAARDTSKAAAALAKKPSTELVADAGDVADKAQAQAIVSALSQKPEEEIKALSNDDKKAVISAASTAVIDMAAIGSSLGDILNTVNTKSNDDSGDPDDPENQGTPGSSNDADEKEMIKNVVGNIINTLGDTDTTCVAIILEDAIEEDGSLKDADNVPDDMKASLTMGAVTVAAAAIGGSDFDIDSVMEAFNGDAIDESNTEAPQTIAEVVEKILPNADEADTKNLETALKTLQALSKSGYDFSSAFGMGGSKNSNDDSGSQD